MLPVLHSHVVGTFGYSFMLIPRSSNTVSFPTALVRTDQSGYITGNITSKWICPDLVLMLEHFNFIARALSTFLPFGYSALPKLALRFPEYKELGVGVVDKSRLERRPAKITQLVHYS